MKLGTTVGPLTLSDVLLALNNRLTPVDNWQCKKVGPVVTPVGANTEFTINHNLGIVPSAYIVNVDQNAVVYDSRRNNWTSSQMFLKCTAGAAVIYLIVL